MAKTEIDRIVTVPNGGNGPLDRYFKISERGSSVRTEVVAGVTTWLTMAYILFLNPQILGLVTDNEGTTLAFPQVLTVTALAAGVMTLAMGLWGRYPFAIAAGLALAACASTPTTQYAQGPTLALQPTTTLESALHARSPRGSFPMPSTVTDTSTPGTSRAARASA